MEIIQVDRDGLLFVSPDIDEWSPLNEYGITAIVDLDDDMDSGVPQALNQVLYIYFPIDDGDLPNLERLHSIARLGACLVASGEKVLAHCGLGHNRSCLLAALILTYLGMPGAEAVAQVRSCRQGALYNKKFANYLLGLSPQCIDSVLAMSGGARVASMLASSVQMEQGEKQI